MRKVAEFDFRVKGHRALDFRAYDLGHLTHFSGGWSG